MIKESVDSIFPKGFCWSPKDERHALEILDEIREFHPALRGAASLGRCLTLHIKIDKGYGEVICPPGRLLIATSKGKKVKIEIFRSPTEMPDLEIELEDSE